MENLEVAEKILKIFTSRGVHQHGSNVKRPTPGSKEYVALLSKILEMVKEGRRIILILGYGYAKDPIVCKDGKPDEAERRSFEFLVIIHEEIKKIYPPGIKVILVTSCRRAIVANNFPEELTRQYHNGLKIMIEEDPRFKEIIELYDIGELWDRFPEFPEIFKEEIEKVRESIINDPNLPHLMEQARRNMYPPPEDEKEVFESVVRFVASFRAERRLQLYRKIFGEEIIILSYRPNPEYGEPVLVIWTTKEGDITQPWRGCWDPDKRITITRERQKRFFQ
jgi:hypothetical protein